MKKLLKYFYIIVIFFCVGLTFYGCSTSTAVTAYEIAVQYGFEGTEQEWLDSLVVEGKSAYELAVEGGYSGTEQEWLASLVVEGASAYEIAVANGFTGTEQEWLASLVVEGDSAYEIAVTNGFTGTQAEWIESLKGRSAYEIAVINGYEGDVVSWLTSLFVVDDANVEDLSAQSLFNLGVSLGEYENTSAGYNDFMADYLAMLKDSSNSVAVQKVAAKCLNQVVSVYTEQGAGAGVIYEINEAEQYAYIITNYHVVVLSTTVDSLATYAPAINIYFYTYGAETVGVTEQSEYDFGDGFMMAEYVGGSAVYDIAVLKVTGEHFTKLNATDAEAVTFADTTNLQAGSSAIAIGNPMGEGIAVTSGVVSVDREEVSVSIAGKDRVLSCLRLDAPINGGNSGGGVFDINGNLIGIANAKYSSVEIENVANAILASNVKNVTENIIHFYELNLENELLTDKTAGVHKYLIGFSYYKNVNPTNTYDEETITNNKTSDIIVTGVVEDSIASSIGLALEDIVKGLKIKRAGSEVFETIYFDMGYEMNDFMLTVREGDEIVLIVDRPQTGETVTYSRVDLTSFTVEATKFIEYKNNGLVE